MGSQSLLTGQLTYAVFPVTQKGRQKVPQKRRWPATFRIPNTAIQMVSSGNNYGCRTSWSRLVFGRRLVWIFGRSAASLVLPTHSLQANTGIVPLLDDGDDDRFPPAPSQFIIRLPSHHPMLYGLDNGISTLNNPRRKKNKYLYYFNTEFSTQKRCFL
jgi:hypothetical protein